MNNESSARKSPNIKNQVIQGIIALINIMDMDYQTWIMPSRAKSLSCRREKMLFAGLSYGPVVKTSLAGVIVSVPDQGAKIPHSYGQKSKA